ncbi:insulinase family protein [Marinomonas sp. 5E14-1]|uniref:insulinase family protein n=1 Tax=Marinomonas sp. 5E14-1 TaxID=3153922 RepID=UPI003263D305
MPDNSKPLFSRPVLAIIMVFCTLAVWVLQLTAPSSKLPTPNIETSETDSGIPIIWLEQNSWEGGDKVEIRFTFRTPVSQSAPTDANLAQTTLAMLMSDSLPLSTASINQRLAPLAAQASSHYDYESQVIGLTLSSQTTYLMRTLSLVDNWLAEPAFKHRTLDNWQRRHTETEPYKAEERLFQDQDKQENNTDVVAVTLEQVSQYYKTIHSNASAIYVIGNLNTEAKAAIEEVLNNVSENDQLAVESTSIEEYEPASHTVEFNKKSASNYLWQTQSAVALEPIASVKEWISLQIWGADLVSTLNKQTNMDFVQLAFTLSPKHPWARWNIQYSAALTQDAENLNTKMLDAKSFLTQHNIPSAQNQATFNRLFDSFKTQLEIQTQSPTWWSYMATQVIHLDGQLTLEEFVNSYKKAIDTFTQTDYQNALTGLLKASTYQEIQVYQ